MMNFAIRIGVSVFLLGSASASMAQEACRQVQNSCSQMKARCEQNCQGQQNPGRCIGAICEAALNNCRQTGIWKAVGAPVCWKTNNKS